jgi:helix-turn-helix resolvase-like protein
MTLTAKFTTQLTTRGRPTKFTPEKVQQIRNLVEQGKSRVEIAELIGVTVGSLQVTCSRLGISLRRRDVPNSATRSGGGSVPLRPINGQPQQNSQSGPVEQAQAAVPYQERVRTKGVGLANLVLRMQYRGDERTTELPLTQDMITQLAFEAQVRDMSIGELVSELIIVIMKKDLCQKMLEPRVKQPERLSCASASARAMDVSGMPEKSVGHLTASGPGTLDFVQSSN